MPAEQKYYQVVGDQDVVWGADENSVRAIAAVVAPGALVVRYNARPMFLRREVLSDYNGETQLVGRAGKVWRYDLTLLSAEGDIQTGPTGVLLALPTTTPETVERTMSASNTDFVRIQVIVDAYESEGN